MVSALISRSSGPGSSPDQGHCVVFLGKTPYFHGASQVSLVPAMDQHTIQGVVGILLVASCYRNLVICDPQFFACGVKPMFDQTCFNRLATHFNISMFGHQTMFHDVWHQTFLVWTSLNKGYSRLPIRRGLKFPIGRASGLKGFVYHVIY